MKDFIKILNKEFGENSAIIIGEDNKVEVDVIPTGIDVVDKAIGVGGIPRGRITEVFGKEGTGKTTLCLHAIAEANKMGIGTAFIDVEHSLNYQMMERIGVNINKLVFSQPNFGEEALNMVDLMVRSNRFGLIVIDSVAALTPEIEMEKDMGDSVMGVHAKLMSQAMRKLSAPVSKHNVALMFTNQTRSKIGVMWGNPETTTGGVALKFYSSLRMRIIYTGQIKNTSGLRIASKGKIQVVKNKLAVPFKEAEFEINASGIDDSGFFIDQLIKAEVLVKAGSFYKLDDEVLAQGKRTLAKKIKENPKLKSKLGKLLKQ